MRKTGIVIAALAAVFIGHSASAENVKITPLGGQTGEF